MRNSSQNLFGLLAVLGLIILGSVARVLGQELGVNLLIPAICTGAAWWLSQTFLPEAKRFVVPAFAVQCGWLFWTLLSTIASPIPNEWMLPELVLLAAGLAWLLAKPGLGPVLALWAYQAFGLLYHGYLLLIPAAYRGNFQASDFRDIETQLTLLRAFEEVLFVNVIWHLMAVVFLTLALLPFRQGSSLAAIAIQPTTATGDDTVTSRRGLSRGKDAQQGGVSAQSSRLEVGAALDSKAPTGAQDRGTRMLCPFCGETIQRDASKCRYCREFLPTS